MVRSIASTRPPAQAQLVRRGEGETRSGDQESDGQCKRAESTILSAMAWESADLVHGQAPSPFMSSASVSSMPCSSSLGGTHWTTSTISPACRSTRSSGLNAG